MKKRKPWPCMDCLIVMTMDVSDDFCKCLECGTEVWFNYGNPHFKSDKDDPQKVTIQVEYVSRSLPEGYKVPAGGSKSGKRPKNKGTKLWADNSGFKA